MAVTIRPVEARLVGLLDHLGIAQTHIAGRTFADPNANAMRTGIAALPL